MKQEGRESEDVRHPIRDLGTHDRRGMGQEMSAPVIRKAEAGDLDSIVRLAGLLWPEAEEAELRQDFRAMTEAGDGALFLAAEDGRDIGFAQCQLRHD